MPLPAIIATDHEPRRRGSRRRRVGQARVGALGGLLVVATIVASSFAATLANSGMATAQTSEDAAKQAVAEIQAARDRANAAADAFFAAQSDLELLQDDLARLVVEESQLIATVAKLKSDVESIALGRFVESGAAGIPLLTGMQAPKDQVQAEVFVAVLTNNGTDALDSYEQARDDLERKRSELADSREEIEAQQDVFAALQEQAEAEVVHLREIEEERLKDEAVQKALEEQQAAMRAEALEDQRRAAEAAERAQPNPGLGQTAAGAAATPAGGEAAAGEPSDGEIVEGEAIDGEPVETVPTTLPPAAIVIPNGGASGGSSGGRTGTGGIGSAAPGIDSGAGYIDNIVCPMAGAAYGDSWGAARSGGRHHEGVDMLAPFGVPIVAVTNGFVTYKRNQLGGNAASIAGDNGNRYYYAHFGSYEGSNRRVQAGEVIGYNGDSGNAAGTPHLHFEIHPGGGLAVNPTPSVRVAGC
jgi:murein DD-endopeptidase MepM/ murein hydrolase activator NlpD